MRFIFDIYIHVPFESATMIKVNVYLISFDEEFI